MNKEKNYVPPKYWITIVSYFFVAQALVAGVGECLIYELNISIGNNVLGSLLIDVIFFVVIIVITKRLLDFFLNYDYKWPVHFSVRCKNADFFKFYGFFLYGGLIFLIISVLFIMLSFYDSGISVETGVKALNLLVKDVDQISAAEFSILSLIGYFVSLFVFWRLVKTKYYHLEITNPNKNSGD